MGVPIDERMRSNAAKFDRLYPWAQIPAGVDQDTAIRWKGQFIGGGPLPGLPSMAEYDVTRWWDEQVFSLDMSGGAVPWGNGVWLHRSGLDGTVYVMAAGGIVPNMAGANYEFDPAHGSANLRRMYIEGLFKFYAMAGGDVDAYYEGAEKLQADADQQAARLEAQKLSATIGQALRNATVKTRRMLDLSCAGIIQDGVFIGYNIRVTAGDTPVVIPEQEWHK